MGICPLCDRVMVKGPSIDEHHFLPKCKGGKEKTLVHKTCHRKLHQTFTENELRDQYDSPEKCRAHPEIDKYIKWLKKKPPEFIDKIKTNNRKKRR